MCAVVITSTGSIILMLKGFAQSVIEKGYSVGNNRFPSWLVPVNHLYTYPIVKPSSDQSALFTTKVKTICGVYM